MLDTGLLGEIGHRLAPPFFRHRAFRADPGTDHHGQYEEDSVRAFHRRPQRSRVIKVTHDKIRSCPLQRVGGGRSWVAYQGADRPITFEQVFSGRAALLTGSADDQHWSLVICHTSSYYEALGCMAMIARIMRYDPAVLVLILLACDLLTHSS
jgi:hypothetical protein